MRLGCQSGVSVLVLRIVRAGEKAAESSKDAGAMVNVPEGVEQRIIEAADPRMAIAQESEHHDLMVLGLGEDWSSAAGPLSSRHASIAQMARCSLLIVHVDPRAPVAQAECGPQGAAAEPSVQDAPQ
jgi:hypothetical protein